LMEEKYKTLTHEEYLAWQTILQLTPYEVEQVDTICTCLINLGMDAKYARKQALFMNRVAKDSAQYDH